MATKLTAISDSAITNMPQKFMDGTAIVGTIGAVTLPRTNTWKLAGLPEV